MNEPLTAKEEMLLRDALAFSNGPSDDVGNAVFGGPEDAEETAKRLLATIDRERAAPPVPALSNSICICGGAKDYHRPQDKRNHDYQPRKGRSEFLSRWDDHRTALVSQEEPR